MNNEQQNEIDFRAWKTFEHTGWERVAGAYDDTLGKVTRQAVDRLLDAAGVSAGMQVLDIATGPGYAAAAAGARGAHVLGIDFSERMIERAWWQYPGIEFRKADAEDLPLSDSAFDVVVSNFGMLHFGQPERALSEAFRVLRKDGRVAFTVWRTDDPSAGFGLIYDAIARHTQVKADVPRGVPFGRFADSEEARRVLEQIGFTDVHSFETTLEWPVSGGGEIIQALTHGGIRTAAELNAQSLETIAAIRQYLDEALERYAAEERYILPMPVLLTTAVKE